MMQKQIFLIFSFSILFIVLSLPVSVSGGMRSHSSFDESSSYSSSMRTIFADFPTEAECRICHDDRDSFPLLTHTNPDKHHRLVNSLILEPVIVPYGAAGNVYDCVHVTISAGLTASTAILLRSPGIALSVIPWKQL